MVIDTNFFSCLTCDAPEAWQAALSEPASIIMEDILIFNNHLLFLLIVIILFVGWLLYNTIFFYEEFNTKFFSSIACDCRGWEISTGISNESFSDILLCMLFILVFGGIVLLFDFLQRIYAFKKRRTFMEVMFDMYIQLAIAALKKTLPRQFYVTTLGFGALIVRCLFRFNLISLKAALILLLILPLGVFLLCLTLLLLPFYLAARYPRAFGKPFFFFLSRYSSKEGFALILNRRSQNPQNLKHLPSIQKRGYRSSSKVNTILGEISAHIMKLPKPTNPKHIDDARAVTDFVKSSYTNGPWAEMTRQYPLAAGKIALEQTYASAERAAVFRIEAIERTGTFSQFRYPGGPIQLALENGAMALLRDAGNFGSHAEAEAAQAFGEAVVNENLWATLGLILIPSVGVLFIGSYRKDPVFRTRIESNIEAGRGLDYDGVLIDPPAEDIFRRRSFSESDLDSLSDESLVTAVARTIL